MASASAMPGTDQASSSSAQCKMLALATRLSFCVWRATSVQPLSTEHTTHPDSETRTAETQRTSLEPAENNAITTEMKLTRLLETAAVLSQDGVLFLGTFRGQVWPTVCRFRTIPSAAGSPGRAPERRSGRPKGESGVCRVEREGAARTTADVHFRQHGLRRPHVFRRSRRPHPMV